MTIANFEKVSIAHPSVDLAIIPIAGILARLNAAPKQPFLVHMDQSLIPTSAEFKELTPVEQVLQLDFRGKFGMTFITCRFFNRLYSYGPVHRFQGKYGVSHPLLNVARCQRLYGPLI